MPYSIREAADPLLCLAGNCSFFLYFEFIKYIADKDAEKFLKFQLVIDNVRIVMHVFIVYLLPGLASYGFISVWADLGGVTLSSLSQMFSEMYLVSYMSHVLPIFVMAWSKVFSAIVFIAIILFVLLSAGKTIHINDEFNEESEPIKLF